jgi:hypothetical protein
LTLNTNEEIVDFIKSNDKQAKALIHETLKMCWYMRGGLTYEEAMNLSSEERNIIGDLIKDNIETTKKSGLPFF